MVKIWKTNGQVFYVNDVMSFLHLHQLLNLFYNILKRTFSFRISNHNGVSFLTLKIWVNISFFTQIKTMINALFINSVLLQVHYKTYSIFWYLINWGSLGIKNFFKTLISFHPFVSIFLVIKNFFNTVSKDIIYPLSHLELVKTT